ncbi:MAG: alpha/beta hydrolase [Massilia sp.]|nr:alpha/beta hydrolase [Massilia sp.]
MLLASARWMSDEFERWDVRQATEAIVCPLLAIQGRQDQFGTLAQLDEIGRHVAGAELLVVEQCRHVPHEEHPDTVLRAIRAFLSALPPPDKLPT